jgi:hypothetical protein
VIDERNGPISERADISVRFLHPYLRATLAFRSLPRVSRQCSQPPGLSQHLSDDRAALPSYRRWEQLLDLDRDRARSLQISNACTIRAILRRLHDSCAACCQRGTVGIAICAVEADRDDAVL